MDTGSISHLHSCHQRNSHRTLMTPHSKGYKHKERMKP